MPSTGCQRRTRSRGWQTSDTPQVAHHSYAALEAELRGLAAELAAFEDESGAVRDALWCCDITTSPDGEPVSADQRITEIKERYGPDHLVTRFITQAAPELLAAPGGLSSGWPRLVLANRYKGPGVGRVRRVVSIPTSLLPEILSHLQDFTAFGEDALIFTGPKNAQLRRSNFSKAWRDEPPRVREGYDALASGMIIV